MDTGTFDRVSRLFSRANSRRSALSAVIGAALVGADFGAAAARPKAEPRSQSRRRRKLKRGRKGRGRRVHAQTKRQNECINPFTGENLNELYGITAQIVAPFCSEVGSGEQWVNTRAWLMGLTFASVPPGFSSPWVTPLEDFLAKFQGVRYVVDPGTRQERTAFFPTSSKLFVGKEDGLDLVSPGTLGTLGPLPVGQHVVDIYWTFSAMHCDGLGTDTTPGINCFPAGETKYVPGLAFQVTPGHH